MITKTRKHAFAGAGFVVFLGFAFIFVGMGRFSLGAIVAGGAEASTRCIMGPMSHEPKPGPRLGVIFGALAALAIVCAGAAALVPEMLARSRFRAWRQKAMEGTLHIEPESDLERNPRYLPLVRNAAIDDEPQVADAAESLLFCWTRLGMKGAIEAMARVARETVGEDRRLAAIVDLSYAGGAQGNAAAENILRDDARADDPARRRFAVRSLTHLVLSNNDAESAYWLPVLASVMGSTAVDAETHAEAQRVHDRMETLIHRNDVPR